LTVADAVDPAQTDDNYPQKMFGAITYTGNGGTNAITGLGFKPDWVWAKKRNGTTDHQLYDSTRGTTKVIYSNNNSAELTETGGVTAFGTDGFTVGASGINQGSSTNVAWSWRANGGTTSTNTQGDINSTVQVDPSGGFSVVKYTGTLSSSGEQTIGHGLSRAPSLFITKSLEKTGNWWVFSDGQTSWNYGMNLQSTGASVDKSGNGSMSAPTSTVFSTNYTDGMNENGNDLIAYCFANTEGYIKSGSYIGNGSNDGTYVYTGFRPSFILIKETGVDSWGIYDDKRLGYNVDNAVLYPESNSAEENQASRAIDLLSNGFKLRTSNITFNQSGQTLVYLAFAKNPFKYATAR